MPLPLYTRVALKSERASNWVRNNSRSRIIPTLSRNQRAGK
uniref:Uncharacterized protein n=1 Tax=Anopheles quadriannulatus TaxID=34691 RepID=A0A182XRZ0_ANOQN